MNGFWRALRGQSVLLWFDSSLGSTFPCPSVDLDFTECESNTRYDNYTSSLMSFSKVVHDRLSAETADSDSKVLFEEVAWLAGDYSALKVQAVGDNGDEKSLTEDVFKAIRPQGFGTLLRFDFKANLHSNLSFSFGRYQGGEWTDVHMPWATITLTDFDCGSNRNKCEEATFRDHSCYDAGGAVKVQVTGDEVLFKDTIISNVEDNPHNVILNEVQKSISVALVFENRNQFTLDMRNYAAWPCTFLLAGITTMQWPEYQTHAPTPSPTPVPTPSPSPSAHSNSMSDSSTDVPLSSFSRIVFCGVRLCQQPELSSELQ